MSSLVLASPRLYTPRLVAPAGRQSSRMRWRLFMKEKTHPDYHKITVGMTDGSSFETRSTWGKEGASLRLMIAPKAGRARPAVRQSVDRGGRVQRFKDRFGMTSGMG